MKRYEYELIVNERSDGFFEEITANGKSGCDEVLKGIKEELVNHGVETRLVEFEDK